MTCIKLHFPYLWVENRIVNKFKEPDLCWYCKILSQVLSFTWFLIQISNKFSQHWWAAWNQSAGRMRPAGRRLDSTDIDYTLDLQITMLYICLSHSIPSCQDFKSYLSHEFQSVSKITEIFSIATVSPYSVSC